jgi:hypothetical protein
MSDWNSAAARNLEVDPMEWTGRMEFDLSNDQGFPNGTVEVVVRIDHLSLWYGNRTLAVMDRDLFRQWLIDPVKPFQIDDVMWSIDEEATHLTIDESVSYAIPPAIVEYLIAVV